MNQSTAAAFGAVLGVVTARLIYGHLHPEEEPSILVYVAGGAAGYAAGSYASQRGLLARNNGKHGSGLVGKEAIALLEQIDPNALYRDAVTKEVKIGLVYPNEKTVGTF